MKSGDNPEASPNSGANAPLCPHRNATVEAAIFAESCKVLTTATTTTKSTMSVVTIN